MRTTKGRSYEEIYGEKRAREEKEKRRVSLSGRKRPKEVGRKVSAALLGHKQSKETIEKRRKALVGRKKPEGFGANIRRMKKGVTKEDNPNLAQSEETKEKIRLSSTGRPGGMLNKHHSSTAKRKISEANAGSLNNNWRGGLTQINYPSDWTEILRESIRERDGYRCRCCKHTQKENKNRKLTVHHIDYIKKNLSPTNLISLCTSCHAASGHNRSYWKNVYQWMQKCLIE